jgi:hypothetical protein
MLSLGRERKLTMLSERITTIITLLQADTPIEDIAKNPVARHPHNTSRIVPERLHPTTIKELSVLEPAKAIRATAEEWVAIVAAIAVCSFFWHPALYVAAVVVIGSCQHALLILGHDASHYRYLASRWQNELFANLFLMWPTFASVEGFRKFHSTHHQYTNLPGDGNRHIWYTHDAAGELEPCWVFPKTRMGLALLLLRRASPLPEP